MLPLMYDGKDFIEYVHTLMHLMMCNSLIIAHCYSYICELDYIQCTVSLTLTFVYIIFTIDSDTGIYLRFQILLQ